MQRSHGGFVRRLKPERGAAIRKIVRRHLINTVYTAAASDAGAN